MVKRFGKRGNGKNTRITHKLAQDLHNPIILVLGFGPVHSDIQVILQATVMHMCVYPGCWISLYEWGYSPEYRKHALASSEFSPENWAFTWKLFLNHGWLTHLLKQSLTSILFVSTLPHGQFGCYRLHHSLMSFILDSKQPKNDVSMSTLPFIWCKKLECPSMLKKKKKIKSIWPKNLRISVIRLCVVVLFLFKYKFDC